MYLKTDDIEQSPQEPAIYGDVPAIALKGDSYAVWKKGFTDWLLRTQQVTLWRSPSLKEITPG